MEVRVQPRRSDSLPVLLATSGSWFLLVRNIDLPASVITSNPVPQKPPQFQCLNSSRAIIRLITSENAGWESKCSAGTIIATAQHYDEYLNFTLTLLQGH